MFDYITLIHHTFRNAPWLTVKGPTLCSQQYVDKFQQTMMVVEFEVANGTFIDESVVPYGMFIEVRNERNTNKSRLTIIMAPRTPEGVPIFKTRCKTVHSLTPFICKGKECRTIIERTEPYPSTPEGTDIWESYIQDYDDKHLEQVVVTVLEYNTLTDSVFDDVLGENHGVVKTLTQTKANDAGYTPATEAPVADGFFIEYEQVKCGWWIKTKETFNEGAKMSLCGIANYYWPNVLIGLPEFSNVTGFTDDEIEGVIEYPIKTVTYHQIKDSYNGPCKALFQISFVAAMPESCPVPTQIITDTIEYEGILLRYELRDCLHDEITITETINTNHPNLVDQTRSKTFAATALLDWPASVLADYDVKPYKGGFYVTSVTVYKPV